MSTKNNIKVEKIDIRKLFFDRSKKIFIEFDLEKLETCEEIYNAFTREIEEKISGIYDENIRKKSKFEFIILIPRSNKNDIFSFMEIKVDRTQQLSNIMINMQYSLCYLPQNEINIEYKRKARNRIKEEEHHVNNRFKDVERDTISNHNIEKYLNNEGVYYFDKEKVEFFYGKGYVDENKIYINYKKSDVTILVDEIKKEECYENTVPPSIQVFKMKCPNFIFQIHQNNNMHFLGLYKNKSYLIWKNAIDLAKIKNINTTIDSSFDGNISTYNTLLYVKSSSIPRQCFIINQILQNCEKREIFLDEYKDKKISDIIKNIYAYKMNIKNNKFFEAWVCLKEISFYVDFDNIENEAKKKREMEKYSNIFKPERIELYNNVVNKVNEEIKKITNYQEEMNNVLKDILKIDLFDNLYYHIYELFIFPYFTNVKTMLDTEYQYDQKPNIIQKFHLLLSKYCANYFEMNKIDNFNCLCSVTSNETENIDTSSNNMLMVVGNNSASNSNDNNKKVEESKNDSSINNENENDNNNNNNNEDKPSSSEEKSKEVMKDNKDNKDNEE